MEFLKIESQSQTASSNLTRGVPFGERNTENMCYSSKIHELTSILVEKKATAREARLIKQNLLGKAKQQEYRMSQLKVSLEHELQKEQMIMVQNEKIQNQINIHKKQVRDLVMCMKNTQNQLAQIFQQLILTKTNKVDVVNACAQYTCLVKNKVQENAQIDDYIQNLETLTITAQNNMRSKQNELKNVELEKTEFVALLDLLQNKFLKTTKVKNSLNVQYNERSQQLQKVEQQFGKIMKQIREVEWSCDSAMGQNYMIEELNLKLEQDLEGVKKHLGTIQKMNHILKNSITEYGITGDKVAKIIASAKIYQQ